jgi:oligosaccharide repeat unit polymerase
MLTLTIAWTISAISFAFFLYFTYKRMSISLICISIFLLIQFQLRPLLFLLKLDAPFPASQFSQNFWLLAAKASLLSALWSILFLFFHVFFLRTRAGLATILPPAPINPNKRIAMVGAAITTIVAVASTWVLVARYDTIAQFTFAVKVSKELAGYYGVRQIAIVAALLALYALLINAKERVTKRGTIKRTVPPAAMLFGFGLIIINLALNFLWGNRINIGVFLIITVLAWHFYIRKFRLIEITAIAFVAAVLLAGLRDLRWLMFSEAVNRTVDPNFTFWVELSTSLHLSEFDALMLALRDAGSRFDFRYGQDFINGMLSWIPRSIYPAKEGYHVGQWFRQIYEPTTVNGWPVTVVGDWYINFSWIGIPLGAAASGYTTAALDKFYSRPRNEPWDIITAGGVAGFSLYGGIWTGFFQSFVLIAAPLWAINLAMRYFKEKPKRTKGRHRAMVGHGRGRSHPLRLPEGSRTRTGRPSS